MGQDVLGLVETGRDRLGQVGMVRTGQDRSGRVKSGEDGKEWVWMGQDGSYRSGWIRTDQDGPGWARKGQDRSRQDLSEQDRLRRDKKGGDRSGHDRSGLLNLFAFVYKFCARFLQIFYHSGKNMIGHDRAGQLMSEHVRTECFWMQNFVASK